MIIEPAPDIKNIVKQLVPKLPFGAYVDVKRIVCMRSFKATSRARARIWSFPKIWQMALKLPPYYVIEVLAHKSCMHLGFVYKCFLVLFDKTYRELHRIWVKYFRKGGKA